MVTKKKFELSGANLKLCEAIQAVGMNQIDAKILVYMFNNETAISKDIEHSTDLRQPEASLGLQRLRSAGIMTKENIKKIGKGRPVYKYSLKKSKQETVQFILELATKKITVQNENIENLKKQFDILLKQV